MEPRRAVNVAYHKTGTLLKTSKGVLQGLGFSLAFFRCVSMCAHVHVLKEGLVYRFYQAQGFQGSAPLVYETLGIRPP